MAADASVVTGTDNPSGTMLSNTVCRKQSGLDSVAEPGIREVPESRTPGIPGQRQFFGKQQAEPFGRTMKIVLNRQAGLFGNKIWDFRRQFIEPFSGTGYNTVVSKGNGY